MLTQRPLLQVEEVLLDMLHARRANQHRVAVLTLHHAVV